MKDNEVWSLGPDVEVVGDETLKRAMYGQDGIELLRARMLPLQTSNERAL
jgi:hypothetical protein